MQTPGTCPRGHAVAPDAVLCTVSESRWRLVGRDASGDRLWKSRLRPED